MAVAKCDTVSFNVTETAKCDTVSFNLAETAKRDIARFNVTNNAERITLLASVSLEKCGKMSHR